MAAQGQLRDRGQGILHDEQRLHHRTSAFGQVERQLDDGAAGADGFAFRSRAFQRGNVGIEPGEEERRVAEFIGADLFGFVAGIQFDVVEQGQQPFNPVDQRRILIEDASEEQLFGQADAIGHALGFGNEGVHQRGPQVGRGIRIVNLACEIVVHVVASRSRGVFQHDEPRARLGAKAIAVSLSEGPVEIAPTQGAADQHLLIFPGPIDWFELDFDGWAIGRHARDSTIARDKLVYIRFASGAQAEGIEPRTLDHLREVVHELGRRCHGNRQRGIIHEFAGQGGVVPCNAGLAPFAAVRAGARIGELGEIKTRREIWEAWRPGIGQDQPGTRGPPDFVRVRHGQLRHLEPQQPILLPDRAFEREQI